MKKLTIILCSLFCCCNFLISQNKQADSHAIVAKFNELQSATSQAISDKNYMEAEKSVRKTIDFFSALPPEIQKRFQMILANNYYTLACIHSLQKDKKKALENFSNAVGWGYVNYSEVVSDMRLNFVRNEKQFMQLMEEIRPLGDYEYILRMGGTYGQDKKADIRPDFTYEPSDTKPLKKVREYFNLDSIAGTGGEISKIINLMAWVHNAIPHHGNGWAVSETDAIDIYNYSKANNNKALNCKALSIVLNECYLSMGFKSRVVACYPKNENDHESHVINIVYSITLNKWILMDATFNAYLTDENDNLLGIAEVRERLIEGQPLILNKNANWNNRIPWTKDMYFDNYMTRFLYWFQCSARSAFNLESDYRDTDEEYISLMPVGYINENRSKNSYITNDPDFFWQLPDSSE